MSSAEELFGEFLDNLKVSNLDQIRSRRTEIAKVLNKAVRDVDGSDKNQMMIGSFGRVTAIDGISDLDMVYLMPSGQRSLYTGDEGPGKVLGVVRDALRTRYPRSGVRVDGCVVAVQFTNFRFEVQPVFENLDGSFSYPDASTKKWKVTKPRAEIDAVRRRNDETKSGMRDLARMVRAWRNRHGVVMGGLLIDTLVFNFFSSREGEEPSGREHYGHLCRDFFDYLAELPKQDRYAAPGSGQHAKVKRNFQRQAGRARDLCEVALEASASAERRRWREVFGRAFPASVRVAKVEEKSFRNTEEFIEDRYPVDIRYHVAIDCEVEQDGWRPTKLRQILASRAPLAPEKRLEFRVTECDTPPPYEVKWKVLNRGEEAERRDEIRGQIIGSSASSSAVRRERTKFRGEHLVEAYILRDGVIVARDAISVPISVP